MCKALFKYLVRQKDIEMFLIFICNINKKLESLQEIETAAVSIDDINFQMNKIDKPPTDLKTIISKKYHEFFDVFSKKVPNTIVEHFKSNHRIRLLKKYKGLNYSFLHRILQKQLEFVKKFLKNNLKKKFIKANSLPYSFLIILAKILRSRIKFYIDY